MSGVKHLADDLNVQRGRVSSREVLLFRGAERNPFFCWPVFPWGPWWVAPMNANFIFFWFSTLIRTRMPQDRTFTRLVGDIEIECKDNFSMTNAIFIENFEWSFSKFIFGNFQKLRSRVKIFIIPRPFFA
jgi:hypothetical protein